MGFRGSRVRIPPSRLHNQMPDNQLGGLAFCSLEPDPEWDPVAAEERAESEGTVNADERHRFAGGCAIYGASSDTRRHVAPSSRSRIKRWSAP